MDNYTEIYIAPYCRAGVISRSEEEVKFNLHVGYSCPVLMTMTPERFEKWLKDKEYTRLKRTSEN